jgi:hypothetical protein
VSDNILSVNKRSIIVHQWFSFVFLGYNVLLGVAEYVQRGIPMTSAEYQLGFYEGQLAVYIEVFESGLIDRETLLEQISQLEGKVTQEIVDQVRAMLEI